MYQVLDPSGIVLAADSNEALVGGRIAELKANAEQTMQRAVTGLLEPLIGQGKVRVVASIDIDASHEVLREEKYDPLSQIERSKQTQTDQDNSDNTKPRDPVSVGQNLPNQQTAQSNTPEKSSSSSSHNGQTINYEIGSTKTERVRDPGEVKRLTVAVVVDGIVDDKGAFQPRPKEELERIAGLVRSAVGFDAKRGDQVVVDTLRFIAGEQLGTASYDAMTPAPRPMMWVVIGGLMILLVGGGAAYFMMRRQQTQLELERGGDGETMLSGSAHAQASAELMQGATLPGGPPLANQMAGLFALIDARPEESVAVIRAWIAEGETVS